MLRVALALAASGCSGSSGGSPGTGGTSSSAGTAGSTGSGGVGTAGTTGAGGTTGSAGTTAVAGTTGAAGTSSAAGTTGTGGTTGAAGMGGGGTGAGGNTSAAGTTGSGGAAGSGNAGRGGTTGAAGAAAGTTGSAGSGVSGCILCEDFETSTTTLDAAKWIIDSSMGAAAGKAEIVTSGAHGSAKAVKVSGGYIKIDAKAGLFSTVPQHFFIRVSMKFDMAQPSGHVTYLMLADKTKGGQLRVGAQNGGMLWNYDTNDTILPDYNALPMSLKPPANTWHCFEFEIDGMAPVMRAWMDGTESPQMLFDSTPTTGIDDRWMRDLPGWKPNISNFSFGSGYPTGTIATWFDDIAISANRVGCQF